MAQPPNPKIDELRLRIKADPKSRLFYPLAEELRKGGQLSEAEQVLRSGLQTHPTYLAAWVSLGRVLRDEKKNAEATDALAKALQLDPANVVAARLLADTWLDLGERVEAIKKYKLVYAMMPGDQEVESIIASIERDLNPPAPMALSDEPEMFETGGAEEQAVPAPPVHPQHPDDSPYFVHRGGEDSAPGPELAMPVHEQEMEFEEEPALEPLPESPFDKTIPPFDVAERSLEDEARRDQETGDAEPMQAAHEESPFEEPQDDYSAATFEIEAPQGMHLAAAPLAAELPATVIDELPRLDAPVLTGEPFAGEMPEALPAEEPWGSAAPVPAEAEPSEQPPSEEADVFAPAEEEAPAAAELTNTTTMAEIYLSQGLTDQARQIYENILAREPDNQAVRAKLLALTPAAAPEPHANQKIAKLESWLARVSRREVNDV